MREKLRVLQVVGDSKYGGATYLILSWCQFLLNRGCDVTLLSTDRLTINKAKELGIKIIDSILIPRDVNLIQDIKALYNLQKLIKKTNFDIVHTYTATPGFIGRMAAWLAHTPVRFHDAQGWPVTEFSNLREQFVLTAAEYLAGLTATRIICASHATAYLGKKLHIAPQKKLVTICNGINPEPFILATKNEIRLQVRRELGVASDCLLIGNTSRLAAQKDNATLIQSIEFLKIILPERPFLIIIAGDGPERTNLENLARSLGVIKYVHFLGFCTDIPGLLAALDVFVSPSLWEGLSISLLEAMASSRPIVTTNILPNAELIKHEVTGLLVSPQSPDQVAKAIARFVFEPNLAQQCATAAKQKVLTDYTIDRMFQETWNLYMSLLEKSKISKPGQNTYKVI